MKKETLAKEHKVLHFINTFMDDYGYSPTIRDISEHFGCSTSTIYWILHALREQNLIDFEAGKTRTITVKGR